MKRKLLKEGKTIGVYLEKEDLKELKEYAWRNRMSVSQAIRIAVKNLIKGDKPSMEIPKENKEEQMPAGVRYVSTPEEEEQKQEYSEEVVGEEKETAKEEGEEVTDDEDNFEKPEFPDAEIPLASLPSSKPVQEPPSSTQRPKTVEEYKALMKLWPNDVLFSTYEKAKDEDIKTAVIELLDERLKNPNTKEDDKKLIKLFFERWNIQVQSQEPDTSTK